MSLQSILLTVNSDVTPEAGVLMDAVHATTLHVFDQSSPHEGANTLRITASDFPGSKPQTATELQLGDVRCVAQACISDVSVFGGDVSLAHVDPAFLADPDMVGMVSAMQSSMEIQDLGVEILHQIPGLQQALLGQLSLGDLNTLISQVQAQLLNLNAFAQEHYGDLSLEVDAAVAQIQHLSIGDDDLLASVQIDTSVLAQPHLAGFEQGLTLEATLDGLFTSPESFPLTLDFSSPSSVQEASELFASAGASSISSTATGSESGDPGFGSSSGNGGHNLG
ncbi:MAG TPA: hypothetical protein VFV43_06325 [Limnobacter sp.]|nr:hypothetical protein [Limnobacter sp.]